MANIDLYSTREMLDALEQRHVPGSMFMDTFVKETNFHATDTIDLDSFDHGKKMAGFVAPEREGQVIQNEGYSTRTHKIPYVKEKKIYTAKDLNIRQMGNHVYQPNAGGRSFVGMKIGEAIAELDDRIMRLEEWQTAQAIQLGEISISGQGYNYKVEFGMDTSHKITAVGTDLWTDSAATIQQDLDDWATLVYDDSGLTADIAIMGSTALKNFMSHSKVVASLDTRRIDLGLIDPKRLPKGVKYIGYDKMSGLEIYAYTEKYWNGSAFVELMDPKKVVVASTQARVTREYGAILDLETDFIGARFPKNWIKEDPSVLTVMLQSAPLILNRQPDAFVVAQVIA